MRPTGSYDLIVVGGGLGGSSLAKAMAESRARVLLLEREHQFKDRVRGEAMWPWGFAELQALGIDSSVYTSFSTEKPYVDMYFGGKWIDRRDVTSTSNQRLPLLNWVHYEMEEGLLRAVESAGAEVRRGARACEVRRHPHLTSPATERERDSQGRREVRCRRSFLSITGELRRSKRA